MAVGRDLAISLVLAFLHSWTATLQALGVEVMSPRLPHECELFVSELNAKSHVLTVLGDR